MKKEILLLAIFTAAAIAATAQTSNYKINNDTLPVERRNEIGILVGGIHFNSFAPEYYLGTFNLAFSSGAVYRYNYNNVALRFGYSYSMQTMENAGGKWSDESSISGKETGSMVFAGGQRTLYQGGVVQFYGGADVAAAYYSFKGSSVGYDATTSSPEQKKMSSIGVNPFLGLSLQVSPRVKISAESSFDNWFIRESTWVPDPGRYIVTHHFTSAPNPLNAVYVSLMF